MSSPDPELPLFHRRSFLKAASLLAGATLMPLWADAAVMNAQPTLIGLRSLGVLSPISSLYPNVKSSFFAGLQNYFRSASLSGPTLHHRSYTTFAEARQLAQEFITAGVSGVVALISPARARYLQDLFSASGVPLFISTVGANAMRADEANTSLAFTSLAHWRTTLGLGHWAARNLGQRAFVAAACHDAGYDALYAFELGYTQAGGAIIETALSHRPTDTRDLSGLMAAIGRAKPDLVYAAYCGTQAVDFVRAYVAAGLNKRIPLAGTSFMGDETWLMAYGAGLPKLYTGVSDFNLINGQPTEPFTALGYHTGRQIINDFNADSEKRAKPSIYLQVSQPAKRAWRRQLVTITLPDSTHTRAQELVAAEIRTGWLGEYGCH